MKTTKNIYLWFHFSVSITWQSMQRKRISAANVERALVCPMPAVAMSSSVDSCLLAHVGVLTLQWKHFSRTQDDRCTKCLTATKPRKKGAQLGLTILDYKIKVASQQFRPSHLWASNTAGIASVRFFPIHISLFQWFSSLLSTKKCGKMPDYRLYILYDADKDVLVFHVIYQRGKWSLCVY